VTPLEALSNGAGAILKRPLSARERDDFGKYLSLLLKWQKAHRLVGSSDPMWIVEHLFLDSLLFLKLLPSSVRSLGDVGSGAGLPGLPIKIVRPEIDVVLIESRRRRAMFLTSAIRVMKLGGARVAEGRVESLGAELGGRLDAVVMRCAGDVEEMIPAAAALVSESGIVVVSGPPKARPLSIGEWATVPGVRPGSSRRFAVYRPLGSRQSPGHSDAH
jgi:16S rRNA (guanine527-N7)-methyltransferase